MVYKHDLIKKSPEHPNAAGVACVEEPGQLSGGVTL